MFVIENPLPVTRWMNNGKQPLISTPKSILPVDHLKDGVEFKSTPIVETTKKQHAFYLRGATVKLLNFDVINPPCAGNFCGAKEMFKDQILSQRCPCYQTTLGDENVCGIYQLKVIDEKGNTIFVPNYTCKNWIAEQTKEGRFPVGVTAAMMNDNRRARVEFMKSVQLQLEYVNKNCGFSVVGWIRRGEVVDQGVDAPIGRNEHPQMIDAGEFTYHISHIEPTRAAVRVSKELAELKFDVFHHVVDEKIAEADGTEEEEFALESDA